MFFIVAAIGMVCPIAGICLSIFYFSTYHRPVRSALLCGISFSAFFYGYIADIQNDIYRHMADLRYYENVDLFHCFNVVESTRKASIYVWDIWCWIIAQFHNLYLLQASGALVGYTIISFIVFDYANEIAASMKQWIVVLLALYCVMSPAGIVIGIRNSIALLLCCLGVYFYFIKRCNYFLSLIPIIIGIFIHHSVVLVFILWLLMPLYRKKKALVLICITVFLLIFNNYGSYLSTLSGQQLALSDIATDLVYSANNYQNYYHLWSFSNIVNFLVSLLLCIILLIISQSVAKGNDNVKNLWNFCFLSFWTSCILVLLIGVNGSRYFNITILMLFVVTMRNLQTNYYSMKGNFAFLLVPLGALVIVSLFLNNRNLAWGTASYGSLLYSSILGYLSRLL